MRAERIDIRNRTNNALERFNRTLNTEFGNVHPNIFHFVKVIKKVSARYVSLYEEVRAGCVRAPDREQASVIAIPEDLRQTIHIKIKSIKITKNQVYIGIF